MAPRAFSRADLVEMAFAAIKRTPGLPAMTIARRLGNTRRDGIHSTLEVLLRDGRVEKRRITDGNSQFYGQNGFYVKGTE